MKPRPALFILFISFVSVFSVSIPQVCASGEKSVVYVITKKVSNGYATTYSYNEDGLVRRDGRKETYTYRDDGLVEFSKFNGTKYNYKYNSNDRLKEIENLMTLQYDKKGRIKYFSTGGWGAKYAYNDAGYISCADEPGDARIYYYYDNKGNITRRDLDSPGTYGRKTDYIYNNHYEKDYLQSSFVSQRDPFGKVGDANYTVQYEFKKAYVPKSFMRYVRYQQWYIINEIGPGLGVYLTIPENLPKNDESASKSNDVKTVKETSKANLEVNLDVDLDIHSIVYPDNPDKKGALISFDDRNNSKISGYELQYSTNPDFSSDQTKSIMSKSNEVLIEDITMYTVYYIRVRAFTDEDGERIWSDWGHRRIITRGR